MVDESLEPLVGIVMLDDDELLMRFVQRKCRQRTNGRLEVFTCATSIDFRTRLRMLSAGDLPVVMACSDFSHLDYNGLEDLAFVADAPGDFGFGGIKASAIARTMLTAHGNPAIFAAATAQGIEPFDKPISLSILLALIERRTTQLAVQIKADLCEAADSEFITGTAAWGPRATIEASLVRIEKYCAIAGAPKRDL